MLLRPSHVLGGIRPSRGIPGQKDFFTAGGARYARLTREHDDVVVAAIFTCLVGKKATKKNTQGTRRKGAG